MRVSVARTARHQARGGDSMSLERRRARRRRSSSGSRSSFGRMSAQAASMARWADRTAEVVAVVREKIDDDGFAAPSVTAFQDARHLAQDDRGVGDVSEGEDQNRGVAGRVVDGDGGEIAAAEIDVLVAGDAL